ncbi:MAG: epoxyqueuosine reductase QueH [Lachnospiraceae bacterium]|nr:epoxyqueuosine reductase QueH [Lachnospiraceae bacterium]
MNKIDYRKEMEKVTAQLDHRARLLLHSCCAPCSSACLVTLLPYFDITCFYYNPNITDKGEYYKRYAELERLVRLLNEEYAPDVLIKTEDGGYTPDAFLDMAVSEGLESCPEGGRRCRRCFEMRLLKTEETAAAGGFEYFTTTLTLSPLKSAELINSIGFSLAGTDGPIWLPSDFKKKDGFKKSIELSKKYGLYRQDYCGCIYSYKERHENENNS